MKISIVTPSFNQGEFIEKTIQSVITQDYAQLDYIVMDGGSTDNTIEILKRYEHDLTWISEPDNGQTHAVNKAISKTSSDIIGWLNSDDIYYPGTIKTICQFFAEHPDVDVVYGDAYFIDRDDKIIKFYPTEPWSLERFKSCCYVSQPATFFRRSAVEKYGLLNEKLEFCMDYEYWLRLGLKGARFAYLRQVFAGARVYPETKTSSCYVEANAEAINMLKNALGYVPSEWVVRDCGGRVKAKYGYNYPEPRYIAAVWLNLWNTTGLYKSGLPRISLWMAAQQAMLTRFLRRAMVRATRK